MTKCNTYNTEYPLLQVKGGERKRRGPNRPRRGEQKIRRRQRKADPTRIQVSGKNGVQHHGEHRRARYGYGSA